jgi:hypothetical protein
MFNGCPLVLNGALELTASEVLDGAHRLDAIIESGISQLMLVVRGVNSAAFETYDIYNKKRSSAAVFYISGEEFPNLLADTLNCCRLGSGPGPGRRNRCYTSLGPSYWPNIPISANRSRNSPVSKAGRRSRKGY